MRIGIFGGSFDPVHQGHLLLAETCRESADLDQVWWIPAAISPHKRHREPAAAHHRWQMLELATRGYAPFHLCDWELQRGGVSFTVDTLEQVRRSQPGAELFLLLGADAVNDLPSWRNPQRICELAIPLAVCRPTAEAPAWDRLVGMLTPERLALARRSVVAMPQIELSSTDIRQRVRAGRSICFRTPPNVVDYIQTHRLYAEPSIG